MSALQGGIASVRTNVNYGGITKTATELLSFLPLSSFHSWILQRNCSESGTTEWRWTNVLHILAKLCWGAGEAWEEIPNSRIASTAPGPAPRGFRRSPRVCHILTHLSCPSPGMLWQLVGVGRPPACSRSAHLRDQRALETEHQWWSSLAHPTSHSQLCPGQQPGRNTWEWSTLGAEQTASSVQPAEKPSPFLPPTC